MRTPTAPAEQPDFSLVVGGPLFRMFRRAQLSGPALELVHRRMVVITILAWVPLAALSAIEGHLFDNQGLTFARDIESHVRLLLALPVLIFAELVVHHRIGPVLRRFLDRRVITDEDTPAFEAAVDAAIRARDSLWLEMALLIFVYTVGHWVWQNEVALGATPGTRPEGRAYTSLCRLLVQFRQYPDLSIHLVPLVSATVHLVLAVVARLAVESAPGADAPRPRRRDRIFG